MRNDKPKVLMLGWEFPPVINGGLGVACHDLSNAMSELANITMIIPKSSPDFKMKNLDLVGINTIDVEKFSDRMSQLPHQLPFELREIPVNLDPYFSENSTQGSYVYSMSNGKEKLRSFNIDNLYGGDVISKVCQFADITTAVASTLDFDLIHAHDWMTMLAGVKIKQLTGKPLVMHIHSLEIDRGGEQSRGWVYDLEKHAMEYADLLMPVSHFTARNMRVHYGIAPDKIRVVHNGSNRVQAFRSEKKFREKVVLFVGRLTRQKGPEKFLEIAENVLQKDPDVRFVMAGTGDHFRKLLEDSSYKSIGNRFHLTGFLNQQQVRYLLSISDVYCMPSVSEPFGLSAVEAAQFGVPCVISRQSGVSELLTGSLMFDFWDTHKAAHQILNLLHDPVLREKVVNDARSNLHTICWDRSAEKVVRAYSEKQLIKT